VDNFASLEVLLTQEDMALIYALDKRRDGRIASDPATVN
jgi:diketogulonate reductase-like aldo/keto reductase